MERITRRAALRLLPAGGIAMMATPSPAFNLDPVFAAIEGERLARDRQDELVCGPNYDVESFTPGWQARDAEWQAREQEAYEDWCQAASALAVTAPTTLAGLAAFLEVVRASQDCGESHWTSTAMQTAIATVRRLAGEA